MDSYILSQVFVCLCYIFLGLTYVIKKRIWILYFSLVALLFNGLHYSMLKAWAGVGVVCIAVIRNVLFLVQQKIKALDKHIIDDWIILILLLIISAFTAVWTFDSVLSLFSIFASVVYTVSVWQKNIKIYKILGIGSSLLNIVYFIFINSLFGIILETIVCLTSIVFTIIYIKEEKKTKNILSKSEIAAQKGEV